MKNPSFKSMDISYHIRLSFIYWKMREKLKHAQRQSSSFIPMNFSDAMREINIIAALSIALKCHMLHVYNKKKLFWTENVM